ncbi:MAG TPA: LPS assembly protein LptD, partial [Candidatus Binataceae bacterium]|nr:LPS assembly protein LptD [Candidatus Binataceae bacterium]
MILTALLLAGGRAQAAVSRFGPAPETRGESTEPINVTGRETIYDSKEDTFTVRGDAVMTQGASVLKADQIELFRAKRQAIATGHVHLIDPEVEVWATEAHLDIVEETLDLYNAKVNARQNAYHVEGEKIRKLAGQNYQISKGSFTSCPCQTGAPDWSIQADTMDVQVGDKGTAHGASLSVLGYPLFKLPFAEFPANTDRHSGFLSGRYGESGTRGFQWLQPYYIVINKSSDATLAFDAETSQRVGLLGEYRLTNGADDYFWADGAYYNESMRSNENRLSETSIDPQIANPTIPVNRGDLIAMARQHLTPDLIAYGDTIYTSDSLLLRELDAWTLSRGYGSGFSAMRETPSHFGLLDEFDNGYARLEGIFIQDLIQPQNETLQRLPELTLSGRQDLPGGLAWADYDGGADYFWRRSGQDGWRFDANPRITVPWRLGDYLYGYGSAGVQGTVWDTSGNIVKVVPVGAKSKLQYNNGLVLGPLAQGGLQAVGVPYVQTGIATVLERVFDVNWGSISKLKNTIEPFANYAYVPRISQGNYPLFDEIDRVNSRSLLTYGFTTRLFARMQEPSTQPEKEQSDDAQPGGAVGPFNEEAQASEMLAPKGQPIFSRGSEVRELAQLILMQAYDPSHQISPSGGRIADLEGILNVYPTSIASLNSLLDYNPRSHAGITRASVLFNLQPPWSEINPKMFMGRALQGSFLQVGYNYINRETSVEPGTANNASEFMTLRAYTDLFDWAGIYV